MSVTDNQETYAREVAARFGSANVRVESNTRSSKIGQKIAEAEHMKIPFMLIVGAREAEQGNVSLRRHGQGDLGAMSVEQALSTIVEESAVPR